MSEQNVQSSASPADSSSTSSKREETLHEKTTKRIVIGVAAFVAVICGLSSLVVTKENEYTLIMRFGKLTVLKQRLDCFKVPFLDSEQTLPKEILCMIWRVGCHHKG
ncbi:MAG: hypothetical protein ACLRZ6_08930 [Lachnospiraceae bacterium]